MALKSFRYMLFPFAIIYRLIISLRNTLYDWKIFKSTTFNLPVICVGNLVMGGSGKTPMIEWLVRSLRDDWKVATLSRGYKRKTKGYVLAHEGTTALEIGDEPMQFHWQFPNIPVAVGEERLVAIPQLLFDCPETDLILLDDAFQHRSISAGYNILLTEYSNLYTRDFMFPCGDLRDIRSSHRRAQVIVVTKSPANLSIEESQRIKHELNPEADIPVFFTTLKYGEPYHIITRESLQMEPTEWVLLVCGIANPEPLKKKLTQNCAGYEMLRFPDHHIFTSQDWKEINKQLAGLPGSKKRIITTEKDAMRLMKFGDQMKDIPVYCWPVEHAFLFNQSVEFLAGIQTFIRSFG
jgi:tetraacyldisaccharide 4'-kinase